MKLTVVTAGLILAILCANYEAVASRVVDRIDRSEIGRPTSSSDAAQARQGFPDDDYYEEEEDEEEEEELQQSFSAQNTAGGHFGGEGGGFEEEEDDNEDDEGDEEEEEDDDPDEQRFMENKRFLNAVYDIL